MLEEIKGDVFYAPEQILIHGCNCFHTWGAGVAKKMKELYPDAYQRDLETGLGNKNKVGDFSFWIGKHYYYDQKIIVINLYSQYEYGRDKIHVDYNAIRKGLETINFLNKFASIAMPRIGAGLAGGDWDIIKKIIEQSLPTNKVKVYYL